VDEQDCVGCRKFKLLGKSLEILSPRRNKEVTVGVRQRGENELTVFMGQQRRDIHKCLKEQNP
jgi:hypothetical protein